MSRSASTSLVGGLVAPDRTQLQHCKAETLVEEEEDSLEHASPMAHTPEVIKTPTPIRAQTQAQAQAQAQAQEQEQGEGHTQEKVSKSRACSISFDGGLKHAHLATMVCLSPH
jgi:hypothetical protein